MSTQSQYLESSNDVAYNVNMIILSTSWKINFYFFLIAIKIFIGRFDGCAVRGVQWNISFIYIYYIQVFHMLK